MEINKVSLSVRCKELRSKGGFYISPSGRMSPQTRHSTIWGKLDYDLIPEEFKTSKNVVIPTNNSTLDEFGTPTAVSGFFKFSRSNFNVFAENLGMKIAYLFNTRTSYNCPARLNTNEHSILDALSTVNDQNNSIGTMVVSVLGLNECLYTLANISGVEQPISDLKTNLSTIKNFVFDKHASCPLSQKAQEIKTLRNEYVYQYLFRDCFGDVDFTSRNSGIIYNNATGQISLAPHFDYGEMLNILLTSKLTPPKLDSIENYNETLRPFVKQESIDRANALKLAKFNSSAKELGKIDTFGEESLKNISHIAQKYPEIGAQFLKDLCAFNEAGYMPVLVEECSNEHTLATDEQVNLSQEFLQSRMDTYTKQLYSALQTYAPDTLQNCGLNLTDNSLSANTCAPEQ